MYELGASWVEMVEIWKWLKLPRNINNAAIYGKKQQLILPNSSSFEDYKAGKAQNSPEVRTYRKWNAENEVDNAISSLKHQNILGSTQTGRTGLGARKYKPFGLRKECYQLQLIQ